MKKNIFVFDLDGTFLKSDKSISSYSVDTIKEIYKREDIVLFATARPPRSIHFVKNVFPNTPFIFYNGAMYSLLEGTNIYISITSKVVREIITVIKKIDKDAVISVEVNDHWYTDSKFNFTEHFHIKEGPEVFSTSDLMKSNCAKILVNNCTIAEKIKNKFDSLCNVIVTDNGNLVQIMDKKASKENAVKHIVEDLGLSMKQVICFGDDHNDFGLFKKSGISVAMGNAINELKSIASYVTETNDNEGISKFVDEYYKNCKIY